MPTVSPLAMENDTSSTARTVFRALKRSPRTGKCFVRPETCNSGCAAPPTSSIFSSSSTGLVSLMASVPDIHGAAHAVAEQVEADRYRKDHGAGQRCDPWVDIDRGAQRVEHQPPFRLRRFGTQTEERKSGRKDHRHRDQAGGVDEDRPQHIAEHVHAHDGEGTRTGRARGLDEVHVADARGDAFGDAGDLWDEYDGQRDDRVDDAGAER